MPKVDYICSRCGMIKLEEKSWRRTLFRILKGYSLIMTVLGTAFLIILIITLIRDQAFATLLNFGG